MVFPRTRHIRVPSLVRKSIRPPAYGPGPSRLFQALPSLETKFSLTAQRVLFTYARLLCSSSCYIAGLAFYNALNSLLTDSTSGLTIMMGVTDTENQSATTAAKSMQKQRTAADEHHAHNPLLQFVLQPIVIRWLISIVVMATVIVFVKSLVHLTEKQFVDQVKKENLVLRKQMLEQNLKVEGGGGAPGSGSDAKAALHCPLCGSGRDSCEKHMTPAASPYTSPAASPPLESIMEHRAGSVPEVKLQPAVLFRHPTVDNPVLGVNGNKQLDTVAKRREYMAEWRSARRNLYRQKPLFVYRLADMLAYYLVFVAVYSLQSTLQLSLPMNSVGLQWVYLMVVAVCSYTVGSFLTLKNRTYVERLTHSTTCDEHDRLRVKQGIQRKLSSYTASSLSYLLAYAAWNAIQATLIAHSTKHTRQHFWFVWLLTLCVLLVGTAIVVLLNVRIHSEVLPDETTTGMRVVRSVFGLLSHMCCAACNPFARPISTSRLHVRVDILEGSTIHTPSQQLGTEGMSYIAALSLGASVAAVLPIAPLDDSTYMHTPTLRGLATYAISISLVAAISTAVLETLLTRLTTRHQDETQQAIKVLTSSKSNDSLTSQKSKSPELYDDDKSPSLKAQPSLNVNTQRPTLSKVTTTNTKANPKKIKQEYLEALTDDEFGDEDAEDEEEENALSEVEVEEEEQKRIYHSKVGSGATPPHTGMQHPAPLQLYTSPRFKPTTGSSAVLDTIITIKAGPHHDPSAAKEPNSAKPRHHKNSVSISIDLQPLDMKRSTSATSQQFSKPPKSPSVPTHTQIFPPNISKKVGASATSSPATTVGSSSRATTTSGVPSPLLPPAASPSATKSPEPAVNNSVTPASERLLPWQYTPTPSSDEHIGDGSTYSLSAEPVLLLTLPAAPSSYGSVEDCLTTAAATHANTDTHEEDGLLSTQPPLSRRDTQHRLLLARTFIHEWYVALVGTFVQGLSLMCAYGWVGLLYFGVLPTVGLDTSTQTTAWVFAVGSFASYAALTALTAKFFAT